MLKRLKSSTLSEFVDVKTSAMIFRVLVAFFMIYGHGFGKVMNVLGGNFQFLDPLGIGPAASLVLAAFAEGVCAFLVLIGFWTRLASLILVINMAVAIFFHHIPSGDAFGGFETAALYLVSFIVIFLLGPGKAAVDGES
ncbi:DoxX family protein [Fodinibius sediminis]|uniref:Putative oxidoreductase n=1 Tax=Fodinibius sediminis TaxID=1214077 RepID=A0A521BJB3_9BACT|nr:DoxX family protein [Fodinibius sediminis]SMO47183.1 putative oxidoreductase [Fodinibius sediminis]